MSTVSRKFENLIAEIQEACAQSEPIGWNHPASVAYRELQRDVSTHVLRSAWRRWRDQPNDVRYCDYLMEALLGLSVDVLEPANEQGQRDDERTQGSNAVDRLHDSDGTAEVGGVQSSEVESSADHRE